MYQAQSHWTVQLWDILAWYFQYTTITLFHTYLSVCSERLVFSAIVNEVAASFDISQLVKLSKEIEFPECIKHKATELYSSEKSTWHTTDCSIV